MAQCFRDQFREANTTGKRFGLWLRTVGDLALTVPIQHWAGGPFAYYTRDAKRAVFFARYEAVSFGGPEITLDHLLLGVLREGKELAAAALGHAAGARVRRESDSTAFFIGDSRARQKRSGSTAAWRYS